MKGEGPATGRNTASPLAYFGRLGQIQPHRKLISLDNDYVHIHFIYFESRGTLPPWHGDSQFRSATAERVLAKSGHMVWSPTHKQYYGLFKS